MRNKKNKKTMLEKDFKVTVSDHLSPEKTYLNSVVNNICILVKNMKLAFWYLTWEMVKKLDCNYDTPKIGICNNKLVIKCARNEYYWKQFSNKVGFKSERFIIWMKVRSLHWNNGEKQLTWLWCVGWWMDYENWTS